MRNRQAKIERVVKSVLRCERYMLELIESDYKTANLDDTGDMMLDMIEAGSRLVKKLGKNQTKPSKSRYISTKMQAEDTSMTAVNTAQTVAENVAENQTVSGQTPPQTSQQTTSHTQPCPNIQQPLLVGTRGCDSCDDEMII